MNPVDRFRQIRRVLVYILVFNWGIASVKLFYSFLIHSASMRADGFHSFSDGASNIMGLFGIWAASRPIDRGHPYGHKKFETLTSIGISLLLFLVCLNVVKEGIHRFLYPVVPEVGRNTFLVMGGTLLINLLVMNYEVRRGKALKSDILLSDALHTRADILTSCTVIATLIGVRLGFPIVDPVASLVISLFIGYAAIDILKESSRVLSDAAAVPIEEIESLVLSIEGVRECHRVRSRGRPDDIYVDLHVLVDPQMHLQRAHTLASQIEERIKRNIQGVSDVVVHIEPIEKSLPKSP